jgi:hypothetical protein
MTRDRDDCQGKAREVEDFAVVEQAIRRRAHERQPECPGEIAGWIGQLRGVVTANQDRDGGPSGTNRRVAGDVVGVAVREKDRDGREAAFLDPVDDGAGFETRIEDHTLGAAAAAQHIGVFTEWRRLDTGQHDIGLGWQQCGGCHGIWARSGGGGGGGGGGGEFGAAHP